MPTKRTGWSPGRPRTVTSDGLAYSDTVHDRVLEESLSEGRCEQEARRLANEARAQTLRELAWLDFDAMPPDLLERFLTERTSPREAAGELGVNPRRWTGDADAARKLADQRGRRAHRKRAMATARELEGKSEREADPAWRAAYKAMAEAWREHAGQPPATEPPRTDTDDFAMQLRTVALLTTAADMRGALFALVAPADPSAGLRPLALSDQLDEARADSFLEALALVADEVEHGDAPQEKRMAFVSAAREIRNAVLRALNTAKP